MDRNLPKSLFRFKQFDVDQTGCAMKINTDGVLLAALAESKFPKEILDIGTGTGVLALMLAQRFPEAEVHAVEIDESASATARRNFQNSSFSNRLHIHNSAIEQFNTDRKFDLIISNPPFFVGDLKNPEEKKGVARHTSATFFELLIAKVDDLLADEGTFWFILPVKQAELMVQLGADRGLVLNEVIYLHSDETKQAFRQIVCLERKHDQPKESHFYIYRSEKIYTDSYKELLKDFFLDY